MAFGSTPAAIATRFAAISQAYIVDGPAERADNSRRVLDDLAESGITGPIDRRPFDGGVMIVVGPRVVLGLTNQDIDEVSGETVDAVATQVVERLRVALAAAAEARAPEAILRLADQEKVDLIAMATHGRSGWSRIAVGSVAETVLHKSATPVLLIKGTNVIARTSAAPRSMQSEPVHSGD